MFKSKLLILAALALPFTVHAGAKCPKADESTWMSMLDMQKKIVNEYEFTIKKFKVDGYCYEIYGWEIIDGQPTKIEVYFNPVNGEIVKKEVD